MTLLKSYLTQGKVKQVLARRPGEAGFSLIELVVVVAVLAILAAIAIPAFTSINDKARSAAAANTLASIVKECAVKEANGEDATFNTVTLDQYDTVNGGDCPTTELEIKSLKPAKYPSFKYNFATGAKTCSSTGNLHNCKKGTW